MPPPHGALHGPHSPAIQPYPPQGLSKQVASAGGGEPNPLHIAADWSGSVRGLTEPAAVQSVTGLKFPCRYGGRKGGFLSCLAVRYSTQPVVCKDTTKGMSANFF